MAEITLAELTKVTSNFSSISKDNRPEKPSGQSANKKFVYEAALKTPIYRLSYMDEGSTITAFNSLVKTNVKHMTEEDFFKLVKIALSIKNPLDPTKYLIDLFPAEERMLNESVMSYTPSTNLRVEFTQRGLSDLTVNHQVVPPANQAEQSSPSETEDKADQAMAIQFMMAWMTRYAIKAPGEQLPLQLQKLAETYMRMYGKSSQQFKNFRPTISYLQNIQTCFQSFPIVKHTLALHVAQAETYWKGHTREFNVLRYCFFQNLEFMGMHAYLSCVSILNASSVPPPLALTWLRMGGAEDAIDEVAEIMMHYDNGMIPNGDKQQRLWKYARLLDDGYFNRMQTTYNPELVATLAWIEIYLGIAKEVGYNSPLNIAAIKGNASVQDSGKEKARAFMECREMYKASTTGASIIDKIVARKRGHTLGTIPDKPNTATKRSASEMTQEAPIPKPKPPFKSTIPNI
ncbi:TPA_asm: N [Asclepias syriaca virus 2]|uniref:Nucleoprotein n=1 Tax=Asclepias syriaca virus 2 TaxID=2793723 RepID=A0A8D9UIP2_9RHAB|nr:N [Asclepias syriaca virus 2] [Asclepias syriaca virus 2]DAF42291.1 TPA_asm: N [Asclepias syriaca virus 2]